MLRRRHIIALLAALVAVPSLAEEPAKFLEPQEVLEPEPPPNVGIAPENPWSHGVPETERRAADVLFQEGNKLLRESITISAAVKYREALTHWDHPNVHFNLAVALMTQDQPVETYEHLLKAVQYGTKPLEQERYQHAKNYIALLEKQLVKLEVGCDVAGGFVELDGNPLFSTPGRWEGLVRAGRHTLVARRDGYVTNQSARMWEGGKPVSVKLELKTLDELTEHHRRWPAWKPWTLLGAGAVVAAAGGVLHATGRAKIRSANDRAATQCPPHSSKCTDEPSDVARLRRDGTTMQQAAMGAYAVGGAALVAGGILTWMNRDHARVRTYDAGEQEAAPPPSKVEISPLLTPGAPGISVAVRF